MLSQREFILNYDHRKISDKNEIGIDLDDVEVEIDDLASNLIIKV